MKKLLLSAVILSLGLVAATPAVAGHHGLSRGHGHGVRIVSGGAFGFHVPAPYIPAPPVHSYFSFSFGLPLPVYAAPVYVPTPVYYQPAPVIVGVPYGAVWIPGHYAWDGGARFYVEGHWSHH